MAALAVVLLAGGGFFAQRYLASPDDDASTAATTSTDSPTSAGSPTHDPKSSTSGSSGSSSPTETSTGAPRPTSASPTSTADPEAAALQSLTAARTASLSTLTLDGRWTAQVASKYVGVEDPLQTTASGGHVFGAADIAAESEALRARFSPTPTLVLQAADYGHNTSSRGTLWVTLVDGGFTSAEGVHAWCDATFANLTAEQRKNQCAPRQLTPPS